jgi:hypothetical protein
VPGGLAFVLSQHPERDVIDGGAFSTCQGFASPVVSGPHAHVVPTQKLLVIEPKLLQIRPRKAGQREFVLLRFAGSQGAFRDILHAGSGGKSHPVMGLTAFFDVTIAESHGYVIEQPRGPEAFELSVSATPGDEWFCAHDFAAKGFRRKRNSSM